MVSFTLSKDATSSFSFQYNVCKQVTPTEHHFSQDNDKFKGPNNRRIVRHTGKRKDLGVDKEFGNKHIGTDQHTLLSQHCICDGKEGRDYMGKIRSGLVLYLFIHIGGKCKQIKNNGTLGEKEKDTQCYKLLHPKLAGRSKGVGHNECEESKELKKEIL